MYFSNFLVAYVRVWLRIRGSELSIQPPLFQRLSFIRPALPIFSDSTFPSRKYYVATVIGGTVLKRLKLTHETLRASNLDGTTVAFLIVYEPLLRVNHCDENASDITWEACGCQYRCLIRRSIEKVHLRDAPPGLHSLLHCNLPLFTYSRIFSDYQRLRHADCQSPPQGHRRGYWGGLRSHRRPQKEGRQRARAFTQPGCHRQPTRDR